MKELAPLCIAAGAFIILALGLMHLVLTFRGRKLHPREPSLKDSLMASNPVITSETTMWKAWIGFNASHSLGAILFGVIYGYLAVARPAFLVSDPFLLVAGLLFLVCYVVLGVRYWFSVPRRGIFIATSLYLAGIMAIWFS